jgi:hypothetical protein
MYTTGIERSVGDAEMIAAVRIRRHSIPLDPRRAACKIAPANRQPAQVEEIGHIADLVVRFAPESSKKKA